MDMSFDDALRLAANTPPLMRKALNLGERTELTRVAGKSFELISLKIKSKTEKVVQFHLHFELVPGGVSMDVQAIPANIVSNKNLTLGHFDYSAYKIIDMKPGQKVFLTLLPAPTSRETKVKVGTLSFTPVNSRQ